MLKQILGSALLLTLVLQAGPTQARPDDRREERRGDRREERDDREDRKYWKERDKDERRYWKERDKEAREHERYRYHRDDDDRDHRDWDFANPRHRHPAPPWMSGYWRPEESRRYVAMVPGDPSRIYVLLDGRWVLRQVRDSRARVDLEGAFRLPLAPPPVPLPRVGLNLHVVLFN